MEIVGEEEIVRAVESVVRYTLACDIQHSSRFSLCLPKFPWAPQQQVPVEVQFFGSSLCPGINQLFKFWGSLFPGINQIAKFRGSLSSGLLNSKVPGKFFFGIIQSTKFQGSLSGIFSTSISAGKFAYVNTQIIKHRVRVCLSPGKYPTENCL